ncbi:transporter [Pandoraea iniqua]|uniref:TolC family protein n=1 Tax=Pandoraea iniqua TaxID=2508288 RepID=UPI0012410069|nr:TolC family protein [Pandoraea iniqua]VVE05099.1 transporter [Pandoraea iniqua]
MHPIPGASIRWRTRTHSCVLFITLALVGASAPSAFAQASSASQSVPFTLEAALQSAVTRSASMQAAQASVRSSAEAAVKAGQLPDPMLKAGIDNLPINGDQRFTVGQDFMTMRRIGIEQEWVSSEKRQLRTALGNRRVDRDRAAYLMQVANVRQQTATAWLNAVYAKRALTLQQALVMHMTHELGATRASYRGAKASAADVAQAQAMLGQAQDQRLKAQQTLQSTLIALSRWTTATVGDVVGAPPATDSAVPSLPPEQLDRVQPALISAEADIAAADADTSVARSDRTPNWSWEVAYQQRGSQYSNMVSVGVSIPLPIHRGSRQDRDVAEKAELGTRARLVYEDTQRQVQADIHNLATLIENGHQRLANLNGTLLPAADQRVQLATAAYQAGNGALTDIFAAKRAQLEAQLQALDVQRDTSLAWAQLEYQVVPPSMAADQ